MERGGDAREVTYGAPIVPGETKETADTSAADREGCTTNGVDILGVHRDAWNGQDVAEKLHTSFLECTFVDGELQRQPLKEVEVDEKVPPVVRHLLVVDDDVVEVDSVISEVLKKVVHHLLKGRESIDDAKWHRLKEEGAKAGYERSVIFAGPSHFHLPMTLGDVQRGQNAAPMQVV